MALLPLDIPPGVYRDSTDYAARGRWWNSDKARFVNGLPEKIGGWQKFSTQAIQGVARSSHAWTNNSADRYFAVGTHLKYYIYQDDTRVDVTPIRATSTINNNPFTTTNGSTTVTVTDTAHGGAIDDFVTFSGATAVGGITISGEYQIVTVASADSYTITHSSAATSGASGGGASVTAAYQYSTGAQASAFGTGWGAGAYGRGAYGEAAVVTAQSASIRLWSEANYGQDLVINPRGGGLYYWTSTTPTTRAVNVSTLSGAAEVPTIANWVMVSDKDQRILALGTNPLGLSTIDPMHIRWSSDGDAADWDPTDVNTSGGRTLDIGREILCGIVAQGEILIFTDSCLYALRDNFTRTVYDTALISPKIDLSGPNAACSTETEVMWMGTSNFYRYNGQVSVIPSSVRDHVFNDINLSARFKFHAGHNSKFNEVWFFYCSAGAAEIDRYAIFNYVENTWAIGTMVRTTWHDRSVESNPRAVSTDGYIYYQESGIDDNSTTPASAIEAFIESGMIEVGDGDTFYLTKRIFPDINFRNSAISAPALEITLTAQNEPGSTSGTAKTVTVQNSNADTETHSRRLGLRLRARAVRLKIASDAVGVDWRAGRQRIDAVESGTR